MAAFMQYLEDTGKIQTQFNKPQHSNPQSHTCHPNFNTFLPKAPTNAFPCMSDNLASVLSDSKLVYNSAERVKRMKVAIAKILRADFNHDAKIHSIRNYFLEQLISSEGGSDAEDNKLLIKECKEFCDKFTNTYNDKLLGLATVNETVEFVREHLKASLKEPAAFREKIFTVLRSQYNSEHKVNMIYYLLFNDNSV